MMSTPKRRSVTLLFAIFITGFALFLGLHSSAVGQPQSASSSPPIVCTQDAQQCSDGSWVSRIPPDCEFAECPTNINSIPLPPDRDLEIHGRVIDAVAKSGVKDITLSAQSSEFENETAEAVTQADGSFTLLVFKGTWQLTLSLEGSGYLYLGDDIAVMAPQKPDGSGSVIELYKSFAVTGSIVHHGGVHPTEEYHLILNGDRGNMYDFDLDASGGEFNVDSVPEGRYTVELTNDDPNFILPKPFSVEISDATAPGRVFPLAPFDVKPIADKIRGRVFNTRDNQGVTDVTIIAESQNGKYAHFEAKTGQNGNYELTVFPGQWTVWLDFSERKDIVQGGDAAYLTVSSGVPAVGIDFPVVAADATVQGKVTLDGVNPVADFTGYVEFRPVEPSNLPVLGDDIESGRFSLRLPSATYAVWLYLSQDSDYGLTTIQPFQQVTLKSGATEIINITVKKKDSVIEGFVKNLKGNIVEDLPVRVYADAGNGIVEEADVDIATGHYQIRVYSGVYRAWTISYAVGETDKHFLSSQIANYALPVSANARVTQNLTVYEADTYVSGKVFDLFGKPVADAIVSYSNRDAEGNLFSSSSPVFEDSVGTDKNGSYEIFLTSGTYRLTVAQEGFLSPPEQTVKISPQNPGRIDFKFLPAEATISGEVRLGEKGVPAYVWAWSDSGAALQSSTDADGKFVLHATQDIWHIGAQATAGNKYYVSDEIVVDTKQESAKTITVDLRLEQEYVLPPPSIRTFDAAHLVVLTLDDGTKITVPAGAIQKEGELTLLVSPTVFLPVATDARPLGLGYDLQARDMNGSNITQFLSDVFIAIPYTTEQLQLYDLTEDNLVPSYWDETAGKWLPVNNVAVDRDNKSIIIATDHFTKFAILTRKHIASVANIPPIAVRQVPQEKVKAAVVNAAKPYLTSLNNILFLGIVVVMALLIIAFLALRKKSLRL